jgi:hypothetical protein
MGSIPNEAIEFYQFTYSFQLYYALGFTPSLIEMSTRNEIENLFVE